MDSNRLTRSQATKDEVAVPITVTVNNYSPKQHHI